MTMEHPPKLPTSPAPVPEAEAEAPETTASPVRAPRPAATEAPPDAPVQSGFERPVTGQALADSRQQGTLAGLITTGALHLALIVAVIISGLDLGKKKSRAEPTERIIQTRIVPIQAGSAEGTRTKGPAYKRPDGSRMRRVRRSKRYRYGPSRRRMPRDGMLARDNDQTPVDDKDDATKAPEGWGSQTGVMAPSGATPTDDRKGAGGTADKGALDPCFSQHAAVVASYKQIIRGKIPHFKRPAFVSADVARNLTTTVRIYIGGGGNILRASTAASSGNPRYDGAAVAHVKAIGRFPAPHRCVMYDKRKTRFRTSISVAVVIRSR
jgi:outer membrane biosynthesis protein TonB